MLKMCYFGAVGRARGCYARGHGFESQRMRTFWQPLMKYAHPYAYHTHTYI